MTIANTASKTPPAAQDLDWLRGFAIFLMIINHTALRFYAPDNYSDYLPSFMILLGSLAPVLFYFSTGWGIGLNTLLKKGHPRAIRPSVMKCIWLILADQLSAWAQGELFYLDFFSFIGLSYLALTLITQLKSWWKYTTATILTILIIRYGIGPTIKHFFPYQGWLGYFTGTLQAPWSSYPLMPWLSFPLLGVLYGFLTPMSTKRFLFVFLTGIFCGVTSYYLVAHGRPLFRWGTMSLSFFFFSIFALAIVLAVSRSITGIGSPRILRTLFEVRGGTSFVVVPIHLLIIKHIAPLVKNQFWSDILIALLVAGVWLFTIPLARLLNGQLDRLARDHTFLSKPKGAIPVALAVSVLVAGSYFLLPTMATSIAYLGQIAICLLITSSGLRKKEALSGSSIKKECGFPRKPHPKEHSEG